MQNGKDPHPLGISLMPLKATSESCETFRNSTGPGVGGAVEGGVGPTFVQPLGSSPKDKIEKKP